MANKSQLCIEDVKKLVQQEYYFNSESSNFIQEYKELIGHTAELRQVAFSPDDKFLASGGQDNTVRIWSLDNFQLLQTLTSHTSWVLGVAFSPDSKRLVSVGGDKVIKVWNTTSFTEIKSIPCHTDCIFSVAISSNGKYLATGSTDKTIKIFDFDTYTLLSTIEHHGGTVYSVVFSQDLECTMLASGSADKSVCLWNVVTSQLIKEWKYVGNLSIMTSVGFTSNGKFLLAGSGDKTIRLFDLRRLEEMCILQGHNSTIQSIAITKDDKYLVSACFDNNIKIWNLETQQEIASLKPHNNWIYCVAISPNGKYLASSSFDKKIKIYQMNHLLCSATLNTDIGIFTLAISPDNTTLALGNTSDGLVDIWDIEKSSWVKQYKGHASKVLCLAFSQDGRYLASGSFEKTVKVWNMEVQDADKELIITLSTHTEPVRSVGFSPDGEYLLSGSQDNTVRIYNTTGWEEIKVLKLSSWILTLDFSRDGVLMAHAVQNIIKFYQTEEWKDIKTVNKHVGNVWMLKFSPKKNNLASCSEDKTIRIWDTVTFEQIQILRAHDDIVRAICFSKDGKNLASCSADKLIKLWNADTFQLIQEFKGHSEVVTTISFTSNGKFLVSGSLDKSVKVWQLDAKKKFQTQKQIENGKGQEGLHESQQPILDGQDEDESKKDISSNEDTEVVTSAVISKDHSLLAYSYKNIVQIEKQYVEENLSQSSTKINKYSKNATQRNYIPLKQIKEDEEDEITNILFTHDSKYLVYGTAKGKLIMIDLQTYDIEKSFSCNQYIMQICISDDHELIGVFTKQNSIKVWNLSTTEIFWGIEKYEKEILAIGFYEKNTIIAKFKDNSLSEWNMENCEEIKLIEQDAQNEKYWEKLTNINKILTKKYIKISHFNMLQKRFQWTQSMQTFTQVPQFLQFLSWLSEKSEDQILEQIKQYPNLGATLKKLSLSYCYYYVGFTRKIPLLNALLYLDNEKLLNTYLFLIKNLKHDVSYLYIEKDEFGWHPFQIAQQSLNGTCQQIFLEFCSKVFDTNLIKRNFQHKEIDYVNSLFNQEKDDISFPAIELMEKQYRSLIYNYGLNKGQPNKYCFFTDIFPTQEELNQNLFNESANQILVEPKFIAIKGILSPKHSFFTNLTQQPMENPIYSTAFLNDVASIKWREYGRYEFLKELSIFGIFLLLFMIQVLWLHNKPQLTDTEVIILYCLDGILFGFIFKFGFIEFKQLFHFPLIYLGEFQNYIDIFFILSTIGYLTVDIILKGKLTFVFRIVCAITTLIIWHKALTYARAFASLAFIIRMIIQVFHDMLFFFLVLVWILIGFTFSFNQLQNRNDKNAEIAGIFDMIKAMYNVLLGDFGDFNTHLSEDNTGSDVQIWILFFIFTFFSVIIMLNLLIAFINDSYVSIVSQKRIAFLHQRVELLAFIDSQLYDSDIEAYDQKYGDKFIFILKPDASRKLEYDIEGNKEKLRFQTMENKINIMQRNIKLMKKSQKEQNSLVMSRLEKIIIATKK